MSDKQMYRRSSLDSNESDDCGQDSMSIVSESFNQQELTSTSKKKSKKELSGYLLKKSKEGIWQKRFFEVNGNFLTYYKSKKMNKLLAALNMSSVGTISLIGNIEDELGVGVVFQLELKDRSYILRTKNIEDAERWMQGLTKARNTAQESSIPEETITETNGEQTQTEDDDDDNDEKPLHPPQIETVQPSHDWEKKKQEGCCIIL